MCRSQTFGAIVSVFLSLLGATTGASDGAKGFVDIVVFVGEKPYKQTALLLEDLCKSDKLNSFCTGQETRLKVD